MLKNYFLNNYIPCLINAITVMYIMSKLLKTNINLKLSRSYILLLFLTFVSTLNYIFINENIRILSSTIIVIIFSYFLFQININRIVFTAIIEQVILFFSELLFAFLIIVYFNNNVIILNYMGKFLTNCGICIIAIGITNIKFLYIKCIEIVKIINNLEYTSKYFLMLIFISTLNILLILIYNNSDIISLLINTFLIIVYGFIVYKLINEKNQNIIFQKENNILINNLNEYEKMLDYQRVNNHENKNQLLVIKSMIEKNKNNVIEYINEIIKEKREDNEIIYNEAKRIPSGGLQGLIYQKMLLMQEKNIEVNLDINSQVRKIDFCNLSSKMNYDICRIVGIIIDNAIEETIKFNKKDREIFISMYVDDWFIIEIANRIKDEIDLSKIYDKGYTSKDKGHGYGLSLLKKIVTENENIINEIKIVNNIFTQIIKIKM